MNLNVFDFPYTGDHYDRRTHHERDGRGRESRNRSESRIEKDPARYGA